MRIYRWTALFDGYRGGKRDGQFVCIANGLGVRCDAVYGQPEPAEQSIASTMIATATPRCRHAVSLVPYNPAETNAAKRANKKVWQRADW